MKEILDKESKKALVAYRIQRAYETLREAEVMIRESFYNAAINRLASFVKLGLSTSTPSAFSSASR